MHTVLQFVLRKGNLANNKIFDILKALVHEQQYAHIQKWPHAISKKETATKELALIQGESIMLLVYSLIV